MSQSPLEAITVAVGSPADRVCSVGAFARAEAGALRGMGIDVGILEPDAQWVYPPYPRRQDVGHLLVHMPSLHERRSPANALTNMLRLRWLHPGVPITLVLHEYSEAPWHWRARARAVAALSNGVVVNTASDEEEVKGFHRRVARLPLGPTLWNAELLEPGATTADIAAEREKARGRLGAAGAAFFEGGGPLPVVLVAGLVTEGKGLDFIEAWGKGGAAVKCRLVVAGGLGPKEKDRLYAEGRIAAFKDAWGGAFHFMREPADPVYKDALIAADMVLLPFDAGVSERRSTFLAAASCGANVATTVGEYSSEMDLGSSGAVVAPAGSQEEAAALFSAALPEAIDGALERRARNLAWARGRQWASRVSGLMAFLRD